MPFQSGAPALNALLGKHVDIIAAPVAEVVPQIEQGAVRALAVTGPRRAAALPDTPTLDELGLPGLGINGWIGILAPARTPPEICAKLNAAREPDRRQAEGGQASAPSRIRALRRLICRSAAGFLNRQIDTWGDLIRATGHRGTD